METMEAIEDGQLDGERETSAHPEAVPDRRAHRRCGAELAVTLHSKSNFYTGLTENISEGGVFIATDEPHEVGSAIAMTVHLADGAEPLVIIGEVRWVRQCAPRGLGVRFTSLTDEGRRRIANFTKRRGPLFYEE